jgi:dihydroorotate dehydrogenase electron transfer subunit
MTSFMADEEGVIVSNREVAEGIFLASLNAPAIAGSAIPGQFVMIRVRDTLSPLLRRPFSICGTGGGGSVKILYAVVGEGTKILASLRPGEAVKLLGPLGEGFSRPPPEGRIFMVGGGMGIAPLLFLADKYRPLNGRFVAGFKSSGKVFDFASEGFNLPNVMIVTEDGSVGRKALATELLSSMLDEDPGPCLRVYACGPFAMLKAAVSLVRRFKIPCEVSLEAHMACGLGACQGCAVPSALRPGYLHVCKDGPVFDSEMIAWEAL